MRRSKLECEEEKCSNPEECSRSDKRSSHSQAPGGYVSLQHTDLSVQEMHMHLAPCFVMDAVVFIRFWFHDAWKMIVCIVTLESSHTRHHASPTSLHPVLKVRELSPVTRRLGRYLIFPSHLERHSCKHPCHRGQFPVKRHPLGQGNSSKMNRGGIGMTKKKGYWY